MVSYSELSYAKINLHLEVGSMRGDGYHNLSTLFQLVDMYDEITLSVTKCSTYAVECLITGDFDLENNTMVRAAKLFNEKTSLNGVVTIEANKNIPIGAGLGGGSSNAATVLALLNKAYNYPLSKRELLELAIQVGSDVPFFMRGRATALATGRGKELLPIRSRKDLWALVVVPKSFSISTQVAYQNIVRKENLKLSLRELKEIYNKSCDKWIYYNDFKPYLELKSDFYKSVENITFDHPEAFGTISGCGSSYVVISESKPLLKEVEAKIGQNRLESSQYLIKCLHQSNLGATVFVR